MKHIVNLKWLEEMSFEGMVDGHKIVLDANPEFGGKDKGPRPKPLMLLALAGCTAMDVVSLLKKMRVEVEDFNVDVEGELTEEHPKKYTKMNVIYSFKGKDLDLEKINKAIAMSEEKYCGVYAIYKQAMEMSYEVKINE